MPILHNNVTINALVSLELDPATADSDFPTILYHKDQANELVSSWPLVPFRIWADIHIFRIARTIRTKVRRLLLATKLLAQPFFTCHRLWIRVQEIAGGHCIENHVRRECQILQGQSRLLPRMSESCLAKTMSSSPIGR
jgi:hypothetical protein